MSQKITTKTRILSEIERQRATANKGINNAGGNARAFWVGFRQALDEIEKRLIQ